MHALGDFPESLFEFLDSSFEEWNEEPELREEEQSYKTPIRLDPLSLIRSESPWLTREEAAAYLKCSTKVIDRLRKSGHLKTYTNAKNGTPLFRKDDLDSCMETK